MWKAHIYLLVISVTIVAFYSANCNLPEINEYGKNSTHWHKCPASCILPNVGSDTIAPTVGWSRKIGWRFNTENKNCESFGYFSDKLSQRIWWTRDGGVIDLERDCLIKCKKCSGQNYFIPSDFDTLYTPHSINKKNLEKLKQYEKCMWNRGIMASKIVHPYSNTTHYNSVNFQWNKMFKTTYPVAIFLPSTPTDVSATVICGSLAKIPLVPNSGAHSYAGLSRGTDDSIIVDFRNMNSINMNEQEESVTVKPGALLGSLNVKLWRNGGWGTPLGNCMTVGMGGHAIGGGIGYWSSLYGLAVDNVLEIQMVDAGGKQQTVNATSNPDLWWAMRGVGPGFIGLVTSIKLKMYKMQDARLTSARIRYNLKDFPVVLEGYFKWLDWVKENEPTLSSIIFAVSDNYNVSGHPLWHGVEVQLLHIQDPKMQPNSSDAFLAAIPKLFPPTKPIINYPNYMEMVLATGYAPVVVPYLGNFGLTNTSGPSAVQVRPFVGGPSRKTTVPYSPELDSIRKPDLVTLEDFSDPIIEQGVLAGLYKDRLDFVSTLTKEMALPRYFFAKSFYVNKGFSAQDLLRVQQVLSEIPSNTMGLMITSERGRIGVPGAGDSAYVHRNSKINLRIHFDSMSVLDVAPGKVWLAKFWEAARFMDGGETYQNFPDLELKDYLARYYGMNLDKLIQIKRKWDPEGYFNATMSIPIK